MEQSKSTYENMEEIKEFKKILEKSFVSDPNSPTDFPRIKSPEALKIMTEKLNSYTFRGDTLLSLIPEYPKEIYVLNQKIGTMNGFDELPPHMLFERLHALKDYPEVWRLYAGDITALLTYCFRYYQNYPEYLTQQINNLEDLPTHKAFEVIDMFNQILLGSMGNSYAHQSIGEIKKILTDFVHNENKPLLKRLYVQQKLEMEYAHMVHDETPERLSQGVYIYDEVNNMNTPRSQDFPRIVSKEKNKLLIMDNPQAVQQLDDYIHKLKEKDNELPERANLDEKIAGIHSVLNDENDIVEFFKPHAREFSFNDIALGDTLSEEEQEEILKSYRVLMQKWNRETMSQLINKDITSLPIKEQVYFTRFISQKNEIEIKRIGTFINQYGDVGIKAFLSLGHGDVSLGDKILDMGEQVPKNKAEKIFAYYAEIVQAVNTLTDALLYDFNNRIPISSQDIAHLEKSLYARGVQLLENFYTRKGDEKQIDTLIASMDRVKSDTLSALAVFKYTAQKGARLPLEVMRESEFSCREASAYNTDEQREMIGMYTRNWQDSPAWEVAQKAIKDFISAFKPPQNSRNKIYTFKKNGDVHAFIRFTQESQGVQYVSALNVEKGLHGFGLGEAMMEQAMLAEAQEAELRAICEANTDTAMRYIEQGFVATGFSEEHDDIFEIHWNDRENQNYISKNVSREEIVTAYIKNESLSNGVIIRKAPTLRELHSEFPQEKVLTRCFRDPLNTGEWYAVYESPSSIDTDPS